MKIFILVVLVAGLGYYLYTNSGNPTTIADPYYMEARIKFKVQNRDLTMVLVGKMVDLADCETRGKITWQGVFEKCTTCNFIDYQCKTELTTRYQALFAKQPTHTSYVVADRGTRFERDGRMIVWGLSKNESTEFCNYMKTTIKQKYSGQVSCIDSLSS